MKAFTLTFCGLLLAVAALAASPFEHEYAAATGVMPQESNPAWVLRHGGGNIQIRDERLTAETPTGQRNFFAIGRLDEGDDPDEPSAWDAAAGPSTVEFRVRCESDESDLEIFQVHLSNGHLQWRIRFYSNKIFPRNKTIDTREPDTYRAVIRDDLLTLSCERHGVILESVPGNDSYAGKPTQSNALWFGSFSPNAQITGGVGTWELDFIRWTNQEALPDLTPQEK